MLNTLYAKRWSLPPILANLLSCRGLPALRSTGVENALQIRLFLQNKPNFTHFSLKNEDFTKKQTQNKANSKPILAQKSGWQTQTNPISVLITL